jgi:hydroxyacylglutathione hydrolase
VGYERRFNQPLFLALSGKEDAFVEEILSGQPEPAPYFALMKQENRQGPVLLEALPTPLHLSAKELAKRNESDQVTILDLREDRLAFMRAHLRGALYAPRGSFFSTVAGSYLQPEDEIYLLVESADDVPELVRALVRIGIDNVRGYALVSEVIEDQNLQSLMTRIEVIQIQEIPDLLLLHPERAVIDVRLGSEFAKGALPRASNIPYTRIAVESDSIPRGRLIVHCASGKRAAIASAYLQHIGAEVIYADGNFDDLPGTSSWSEVLAST